MFFARDDELTIAQKMSTNSQCVLQLSLGHLRAALDVTSSRLLIKLLTRMSVGLAGARNSRGTITICGEVDGRNGNGAYVGMRPYVGVLMGTPAAPEFVVVGIAASDRERAEVRSLCRESGVSQSS